METTSRDALYNITRDGRKVKKRSVVLPKFEAHIYFFTFCTYSKQFLLGWHNVYEDYVY